MKTLICTAIALAIIATLHTTSTALEDDYRFEIERRINAHGNEFMGLAQTNDGRYLIVGTESGKLLIWGISERQIVRELDQGSPVHRVVALNDADTFIAAGGPHAGHDRPVIRKWRISTGQSEEWQGLIDGSVMALAFDPKSGLIAAGTSNGHLTVWNSATGKVLGRRTLDSSVILGITVNGDAIYVTKLANDEEQNSLLRLVLNKPGQPPSEFVKVEQDKVWANVALSPDAAYLAAQFATSSSRGVALFEVATGKEISKFDAHDFAWSKNRQLVLFDSEVASKRISIDMRGRISSSELLKGAQWHSSGAPAKMNGQIVSADGSMAWEVFQLGATLVELDLNKTSFNNLYSLRGYVYAMNVREESDLIATAGDDEYIRVRKLSDLSFVKEFKAAPGVPQGVALMEDGKHVVFSASSNETPTRISVGDLGSGQSRTLFELPESFIGVHAAAGGFIYKRETNLVLARWTDGKTIREYPVESQIDAYAVSANGKWIVVANEPGYLFRFDVATGKRTNVSPESVDSLTSLAITNDGHYVYTTEFHARLKQWDAETNTVKELASIRGQARTLQLSRDEKEIVIGGNHRDVAVYETATGERRLYFDIAAADFYVTTAWLSGDRLLFSTDAGVLFDGAVKR